jgi:hypothetical protein
MKFGCVSRLLEYSYPGSNVRFLFYVKYVAPVTSQSTVLFALDAFQHARYEHHLLKRLSTRDYDCVKILNGFDPHAEEIIDEAVPPDSGPSAPGGTSLTRETRFVSIFVI